MELKTIKEFTLDEVAQFSGENGKPTYIVHQGKVFDVSNSKLWKGGLHMRRHHAGKDLTTDFQAAPHGEEVLARYPQVGVLRKEVADQRKIPRVIAWLIIKFPMLRRHPHPMTVHFPIVFAFSATVFNLLYLATGVKAFEVTALHCVGGGVLFTPVAIVTGLYTWWLNYLARPVKAVAIKQRISAILFVLEVIVFIWRVKVPHILASWNAGSASYLVLVLSLLPLVTIIGWYGAKLSFPIEKERSHG
jgi:predicted heme/steroid binding protein/uncharacterized membrane protein